MSEPLLAVDGLCTNYGKIRILRDVSLSVGQGEVVALLGLNGAGKTTTLRSILGLTAARAGTIRYDGHDITAWPAYKIAAAGRRVRPRRPAHVQGSQHAGEPAARRERTRR